MWSVKAISAEAALDRAQRRSRARLRRRARSGTCERGSRQRTALRPAVQRGRDSAASPPPASSAKRRARSPRPGRRGALPSSRIRANASPARVDSAAELASRSDARARCRCRASRASCAQPAAAGALPVLASLLRGDAATAGARPLLARPGAARGQGGRPEVFEVHGVDACRPRHGGAGSPWWQRRRPATRPRSRAIRRRAGCRLRVSTRRVLAPAL